MANVSREHPLKIGLNLYLFRPEVGGIANYVVTLLREWNAFYPKDILVPFTFDGNEAMMSGLPRVVQNAAIHLHCQEEILCHAGKVDVFFCPFGGLYPRPFPRPSVVTIVDIQERFFPEFFTSEEIANRRCHFEASLQAADQVITISDFSRHTMLTLLGADGKKVRTIHLCPDALPPEDQCPKLPPQWPEDFVFFPAQDWPHKNHARLLESLALLRKQDNLRIPCIFTGNWQQNGRVDKLIIQHGLQNQAFHLGRVNRSELAWLYRNARLLIYPSLFEGFGIPLLEAMRSQLPVVCSGTTSLPEVAGDAAVYCDPLDTQSIARAIRRVWKSTNLQNHLRTAGVSRATLFNEEQLVRGHRKVFLDAIQQFSWRGLMGRWKERIRHSLRRSDSQSIPPEQLAQARQLLDNQRRNMFSSQD